MQYINNIKYLFLLPALIFTLKATAQNNTSPYSIIGIGDIEHETFDRSTGMASTGVSQSSPVFLYSSNPASLGKFANYMWAFEVTGRFRAVNYKGAPVSSINGTSSTSSDIQMERIAAGIKIKQWWGAGIGLQPFSTSNYSFSSPKSIIGSSTPIPAYYTGTGGLNQVYFSNAFNPVKNLSIGLQSSLLFGSLNQQEDLGTDGNLPPVITTRNIYLHHAYFKAGIHYQNKISKKIGVSVGATASNKTNLNADYDLTVTQSGQTIHNSSELIDNYFTLPVMYSVGTSVNYDSKYTLSLEYQSQQWDNLNYKGMSYALQNSNRFAAGFEYSKDERYYLQGGFFYNDTYLRINNQKLPNYGFTAGYGASAKRSTLSYQVNLSLGVYGTLKNNLVKQNYAQISLLLAYRDRWWSNVKKYD